MGYKKFKYKIFKKYFEKILFRSKWMYIKYSDPLIQIDRYIEIENTNTKSERKLRNFQFRRQERLISVYYSILHILLVTNI